MINERSHFLITGEPKATLSKSEAEKMAAVHKKQAYLCLFCNNWHIGGKTKTKGPAGVPKAISPDVSKFRRKRLEKWMRSDETELECECGRKLIRQWNGKKSCLMCSECG